VDAGPYNLYVCFAASDHGTLFVSARCTPSVGFAASSRPQGPVNTVAQRGVYEMGSRKEPKNAVILHKIAQAKLCNPTKLQISEKTFKKPVRFFFSKHLYSGGHSMHQKRALDRGSKIWHNRREV